MSINHKIVKRAVSQYSKASLKDIQGICLGQDWARDTD